MFGVAVARLTKVSVGLPPLDGTIIVGYRDGRQIWSHGWKVCDRHQKILKLKSSLGFYICYVFTIYLDYVKSIQYVSFVIRGSLIS